MEELAARSGRILPPVGSDVWKQFDAIHSLMKEYPSELPRLTREVLEDYESDGVEYIELRTTPSIHYPAGPEEYVASVVNVIASWNAEEGHSLVAKLLLSLNRQHDTAESSERTLTLAKLHAPTVVGIDFSGNHTFGNYDLFTPILTKALVEYKLPLAIHVGEEKCFADQDDLLLRTLIPLAPAPNMVRIGHGIFLHYHTLEYCASVGVPLEVCITSNLMCNVHFENDPKNHHIHKVPANLKLLLGNCDDKLVFNTTTPREIDLATPYVHDGLEMKRFRFSA
jgi:adenosine deaminase